MYVHNGERGNRETPSHKHKPTMNSGLGIAKPREVWGMALSQPLLVLEECAIKFLSASTFTPPIFSRTADQAIV